MISSKTDRISALEYHRDLQTRQIQDLFKEIGALQAWRGSLSSAVGRIKGEIMGIREDFANMRKEVDDTKTVSAGAVVAISGLSQSVKDLQARIDANPEMTAAEISAELAALSSELDSSQSDLAAAIANVPAAQSSGGTAAQTAAERAASEGNATLEQPNAPK